MILPKFLRFGLIYTFCAVALFAIEGQAQVSYSDGVFDVDVSGTRGTWDGQDGDNGGQIDLTLAYVDANKTQVRISGTARSGGQSQTISQILNVADLKKITLEADGGSGAPGQDGSTGRDGYDGRDGWSGASGCPPQAGTDGEDGTDGGNGTNGDRGGNGGSGGNIRVHASPDQTELLLFVQMSSEAGNGGRGGSGGAGGRGGHGGRGGSGGTNTCDPKGNDAPNGRDGRDGFSGQSGYNGGNGYAGRDGAASFEVGGATYDSAFALSLKATTTEDIQDGVLEPGEKLNVSSLEVTNTGAMPTPAGQLLKLTLVGSDTLQIVTGGQFTFNQTIQPGQTQKLTFSPGQLVLGVPDDGSLIGQSGALTSQISINHVNAEGADLDSNQTVNWPLKARASVSTVNGQFESITPITYTIRNISTKDIGPNGVQPFTVNFSWDSNNIPDSAVTVILNDGRRFNLAHPSDLRDITVPAGKTIQLVFNVAVLDANSLKQGVGNFNFGIKMKSLVDGNERVIQSAVTTMNMILDLFDLAFDQTYNLSSEKISCVFKNRSGAALPITWIHFVKKAGGTRVAVQIATSSQDKSPTYQVASHLFFPYLENFEGADITPITVDLLNTQLSGQSSGAWSFRGCK